MNDATHLDRLIPDTPTAPEHGYESVDWSTAPLAQRYGLPGETHTRRRRDEP